VTFVDLRRLPIALAVLGLLLVPAYLLLVRPQAEPDADFANARLIDTPLSQDATRVGLRPGELAPNFELSTHVGERLKLSDLRGRPVLITFYALWCGSCLAEMPDVKALQEQRGLDSLHVLAINAGESRDRALEFIDFIKAPFSWGLDFDLTVSDAYSVYGLPYSVYLDATGTVRAVHAGLAEKERLSAYVDAAFKSAPAPDLPGRLRHLSTLPRETVLHVQTETPGHLVFSSRRLRCDAGYCAEPVLASIRALAGVTSVKPAPGPGGLPAIEVRFDSALQTPQQLTGALVGALDRLPDPLYTSPIEVKFAGS
jgi:peroxiredoxin